MYPVRIKACLLHLVVWFALGFSTLSNGSDRRELSICTEALSTLLSRQSDSLIQIRKDGFIGYDNVIHYPDMDVQAIHVDGRPHQIVITSLAAHVPDGIYRRTSRGIVEIISQKILPPYFLSRAYLKDKVVLDIGTGDGKLVSDLRAKGFDAYGTDIYLTQEQREFPYFFLADARNTGLPEASVDVIFVVFSIFSYHEKEIVQYLSEAEYLLRPGGTVVISPYTTDCMHCTEPNNPTGDYPTLNRILDELENSLSLHARPKKWWFKRNKRGNVGEPWIELRKGPLKTKATR